LITELYDLCDKIMYKSGWTFNVMDTRAAGGADYTLAVVIWTKDAYHPEMGKHVMHYTPVPDTAPLSWTRWLLDQIVKIEIHEACEFFQIDGVRPFAPSHEPGDAPYIITESG
jgi:hypothetical protein